MAGGGGGYEGTSEGIVRRVPFSSPGVGGSTMSPVSVGGNELNSTFRSPRNVIPLREEYLSLLSSTDGCGSSMWKLMMSSGVFDDCYPQRVLAAFHFLASEHATAMNVATFSLKDLIAYGAEVFSYLSLDVERDNSFATMDSFRLFDRTGRGTVHLEEFVIGVMEKLYSLSRDVVLLESIAISLLNVEQRCTELATLLEKGTTALTGSKFEICLRAHSCPIRTQIRLLKTRDHVTVLDISTLVTIFQTVLIQTLRDTQRYFHLSVARLSGLGELALALSSVEMAMRDGSLTSTGENSVMQFFRPVVVDESPEDVPPIELTSLPMVWDIHGQPGSDGLGVGTRPRAPTDNWRDQTGREDGSFDDTGVNAPRLKRHSTLSHVHGAQLMHPMSSLGGGDLGMMLQGLTDEFPVDVEHILSAPPVGNDPSQLRLLQEALDALNNFFLYRATSTEGVGKGVHIDDDAMLRTRTANGQSGNQIKKTSHPKVKSSIDVVARLREYKELINYQEIENAQRTTTNEVHAPSDATRQSTVTTTTKPSDSSSEAQVTVLETILAEDLFQTQEILSRTQARLQVLELIQTRVLESEIENCPSEVDSVADSESLIHSPHRRRRFGAMSDIDDESTICGRSICGDDDAGDGVEELDDIPEVVSYESIVKELNLLSVSLSQRSQEHMPLGMVLRSDIAVVDAPYVEMKTLKSGESVAEFTPPTVRVDDLVLQLESLVDALAEEVRHKISFIHADVAMKQKMTALEASYSEFRLKVEQAEIDRNELMALTLELQVLRERNTKMLRDEMRDKELEATNEELQRRVVRLEEELTQARSLSSHAIPVSAIQGGLLSSSLGKYGGGAIMSATSTTDGTQQVYMSTEEYKKLSESIASMTKRVTELQLENEQNAKENHRLKTGMKVSEQRVKGSLQDQMTLHQQIQNLEEEITHCKATITKQQRELDDARSLRSFKEEAERHIFELQKELTKREVELHEARDNSMLANKYHTDLISSERTIESLEHRVAEYSVELERGSVAVNQLESYREQVRLKSQENRDLSLQIHQLENQLKDVPYLQNRVEELTAELHGLKVKCEKIPGLLAEIARLRGSHRASQLATIETDKVMSVMKTRLKQLEKENAMLTGDHCTFQDMDAKLTEAHSEIKRLMTKLNEKGGTNNAACSEERSKKKFVLSSSINPVVSVNLKPSNLNISTSMSPPPPPPADPVEV